MSDVARLRQAATDLRAIGLRLAESDCRALRHAVKMANDQQSTWSGPFVAPFTANLGHQERGVEQVGSTLLQLAGWLDQMADQRDQSCMGPWLAEAGPPLAGPALPGTQ